MPKYLDLFAGAGGLSEGFIRAGYEPIAHVEMDAAACYTLRTRTAYHWLKKGNNLAPYTKYLAGDIPRKDFYALVPKEILDSVLNYEISEESLPAIFKDIDSLLGGEKLDLIVGGPPCQAYSIAGRSRSECKIRELGQAATWIRADIDQHLDVMYKRRFEDKRYPTKEEYRKNRRYIWRDEELTSRISGSEVTASLANLGIRYPGEVDSEGKIKEHPIDICLATNMISVGLDVSRLGLMTVAGQPKTTSEYIQATSRVGRDAENAPGLVFVLYRPGRPRDKSHYEQFRSYHSRVYCNVEPTSVTPFSAPVRERALHAIMVGMMRLESDDRFNEDPPRFPDDGLIDKVRSVIENRVDDIDSEELDATLNRMEYILQCWEDWNPRKWEPAKNPDWSYADPVPLMYSAGSHPNEAWGSRGIETPTSMRSVDASCEAEVLTNRYVPKEG